jgi:predicted transcriptional regulator
MYGVKTFEELQNSFIFDIQEFERLSKVIAKDIDVWVKNVTSVYEELCST